MKGKGKTCEGRKVCGEGIRGGDKIIWTWLKVGYNI